MSLTASAHDVSELNRAAMAAMAARNVAEAERLLRQALQLSPRNLAATLNLAGCRRAQGDFTGALALAEAALAIDPRTFVGRLMQATLLERLGHAREAGEAYGVALGLAPPEDQLDPPTRQALAHARTQRAAHVAEEAAFLEARLQALAGGDGPALRRARQSVGHFLRTRKRYVQEPVQFYYPGLPAIAFYDREEFPWIEGLEARTAEITAELLQVLDGGQGLLTPYVDYGAGVPLDQWAALNRSLDWSAFHLSQNGGPVPGNAERCPRTLAALADLPQPRIPHRSPASMFSILKPGVRLPPHTGVSNTRLVAHLPLVVPPGCGFRVGDETREWRRGEAWVFDDTIEHEAWNDSDQTRAILIFDLWNPRLSADDRQLITELMIAIDDFNGGATPAPGL